MKSLKVFTLTLGLVFTAGYVFAAAETFKLGVVDFQRALNGVDEGKTAKAKLQTEFESKKAELEKRKGKLDKLQADIADLQKKIPAGNPQMASPELLEKGKKLETDFRTQFEEYTKLMEKNQKEISEKESSATSEILQKLKVITEELGRQGSFSMILERGAGVLLYASESTDLTEKVIQTFNTKFKGKGGSEKKPETKEEKK
jgi:outer membrane protein